MYKLDRDINNFNSVNVKKTFEISSSSTHGGRKMLGCIDIFSFNLYQSVLVSCIANKLACHMTAHIFVGV